ncbi:beta strand repeat-containing protein, partial [Rheinheimera sp. UJ63]|uniref:beta strand repeat-containing protein n=1 Tax=Rheinheimera sp. UJ63 TaxID=2910157 RepID=UPI0029D9D9A9|nr:hypothetical protein [Rheinheimera sp. UJ63]
IAATVDNTDGTIDLSGTTTDVAEGTVINITITDQNGKTVITQATVLADGSYQLADVDVSALADGPLTIAATAVDNNGNPLTADTNATLDAIEGSLDIAATVDNTDGTLDLSGTTTDVAEGTVINITITDQNGKTVITQATVLADGSYQLADVDVSALADGPLTIEATAVDNNGNPLAADTSATLDAVAGSLDIAATVDNTDGTIDLSGTTTDVAEGTLINITITDQNGQTVITQATVLADGSYQLADVDVSALADGPLTIEATAVDNNGNPLAADTSATLDAIAGSLDIAATIDNTDGTLDLSGTTTDVAEGTVINITITDQNGQTVITQATVLADGSYQLEGVDVSALADGPLTIDATAVDNNGNPLAADTSATLDAVAGSLDIAATVDNTDGTLDLSGTTTDVAEGTLINITITDQNGKTVITQATVLADGSYQLEGVDVSTLADGPLTIAATAVDNNGNPLTADTNATLDAIEGSLDIAATVDNTDGTIDLSGTTTDVAEGTVINITITDQNGQTVITQATVLADGSYQLADVDVSALADGPLTIAATAVDNNGNPLAADTNATLDAIEGSLDIAATVDNTDGTLDLSGTTTDVAEGTLINITITDQNGQTVITQATVLADGSYQLADVDVSALADGPLTIAATAVDNNGNPLTADTNATLDAIEGSLDIAATVDNTDGTLDLSGTTTDVAEGTVINITITDQNGKTVITQATVLADGSYQLEGVDVSALADGPLTIEATAVDNNGNPLAADTSATLDAIAGSLDIAATIDNTDGTLDLSGTTTDVAEGTVINITITDQNGQTVITQATVLADGSYQLADVDVSALADGPLTIEATAVDNNGNPLTADTNATLDAIEGSLDIAATVDNTDGTLDLSGTTTDVAEGTVINITITDQNGQTVITQATVLADGSYQLADVDISALADGPLTIEATAVDNNGNPLAADTSATLDAIAGSLDIA